MDSMKLEKAHICCSFVITGYLHVWSVVTIEATIICVRISKKCFIISLLYLRILFLSILDDLLGIVLLFNYIFYVL